VNTPADDIPVFVFAREADDLLLYSVLCLSRKVASSSAGFAISGLLPARALGARDA
jgi:hypothetical protein